MNSFSDVVNLWPAAKTLATELGEKRATVQKWRERDWIPAEYWLRIIDAGKRQRIRIPLLRLAELAAERQNGAGT